MCNLKMYIEDVFQKAKKIDPKLVRHILKNLKKADFDPTLLHVTLNDCSLKDEYMLKPLIETYKCRHWQIRSLNLTDC